MHEAKDLDINEVTKVVTQSKSKVVKKLFYSTEDIDRPGPSGSNDATTKKNKSINDIKKLSNKVHTPSKYSFDGIFPLPATTKKKSTKKMKKVCNNVHNTSISSLDEIFPLSEDDADDHHEGTKTIVRKKKTPTKHKPKKPKTLAQGQEELEPSGSETETDEKLENLLVIKGTNRMNICWGLRRAGTGSW